MMESIRKWFYRPKRDDTSLLAQFFYANEALTAVACELDSFDGRQEPERCTTLVNQLRHCQDKVLTICNQIMDQLIPDSRANRDFRVKFPDDVMQENLAGQLWFGAECLAAGSSIMNREVESSAMRPLAKALTKSLEIVRNLLREHALKGHMNLKELFQSHNPLELEKLTESLKIFDRLFADFELCYVAAMVPVKSTKEYEQQELVCVLFSETLQRALERGLLNQADVDNYEPALMFTIPRLAIVSGLLAPPDGPLCLNSADSISEMFRPFRNLLVKIRELLWTLNNRELYMLEKLLCSNEEPSVPISQTTKSTCRHDLEEFVHNFYTDYPNCKDFIDFYSLKNCDNNINEVTDDGGEIFDDNTTKVEYFIQRKLQPQRNKDHDKREKSTEYSSYSNNEIANDQQQRDHFHESTENNNELASRLAGTSQQSESLTSPNSSNTSDTSNNNNSTSSNNSNSSSSTSSSNSSSSSTSSNSSRSAGPEKKTDDNSRSGEDGFFSTDITQILGTTENIEIPQTQYLLNQVSHENNIANDTTIQIDNSLPDMDSRQLISEANKTLSTLLLEGECSNEVSEQTDSGICTVVSSENTSLYDKSPEEKKNFPTDIEQDTTGENTQNSNDTTKNCRISSNFNGSNEEFVGLAYGNGQITVCESNHSSIQINYTDNWENLNLNIDTTASTASEFWRDIKCKNCPSTSGDVDKIGKITVIKSKEHKLRNKRHQRKLDKKIGKRNSHDDHMRNARLSLSSSSSRSNSQAENWLNPRLASFTASLHPSQNTRRMPNFTSQSPQTSPRLCHFETRSDIPLRNHNFGHRSTVSAFHNRKLLHHRRSRSEQIAKMRRKDIDSHHHHHNHHHHHHHLHQDFPNDGLGRRIDKSGLITGTSTSTDCNDTKSTTTKTLKSNTPKCCATQSTTILADATSSCSTCYDSSSETSEFQSDCQDDEEIALAMQAAEIANRNHIRAKFRSSEDLVHRLFVCIAGVADQLQTNFASDLRNILKCVFLMNSQVDNCLEPNSNESNQSDVTEHSAQVLDTSAVGVGGGGGDIQSHESLEEHDESHEDTSSTNETISPVTERGEECVERAPVWVPDNDAPRCMACQAGFTVVRRRHHCRNCGKVFCGRCSNNNVPLPRYGHMKPVRVCNRCFLYQVTPFTVSHVTSTS